ncbi:glycerophosphodiester phosphodiesterase [Enterococcus saigonensis]|uniref:Glycerophosphodiester phosphodiesterase n=1 Tax=Enterococcus saigonensis TaxID=1805431 RepID=A0A679IS84_9ENTE|nr:glycerophosphodiester phosphodiesterase [Enterococcus saigonensis]BCA87064.1 glycerophosphodiester phosphodiesterase [Enterococcus saigonensis]
MNTTIRASTKEFFAHWGSYILLILTMNLALQWLVVPAIRFLTEQLLTWGNIPYLTITNLFATLLHHPFVALGLIAIVILLLLALFWQFSFLLYGISLIKKEGSLKPVPLIKYSLKEIAQLPKSTFGYFLIYGFLILPFANFFFRSILTSKIKIPDFVLTFLITKRLFAILIFLFFLIMAYVGIRLLYFLPNLILQKMRPQEAFKASWNQTKGHSLKIFLRLLWLNVLTILLMLILILGLYLLQLRLDQLNDFWPFVGATLNLGIMEIATQLITLWAMVVFFQMILPAKILLPTLINTPNKSRFRNRIFAGIAIFIFTSGIILYNALFLTGALTTLPLTISHRGVDGNNGVQNTISAMAETMKAKPDYIEMDIHETKDHQFVVMHDENLKDLASIDKAPHELTLAQLTALTVKENGHQAKIASFDDYLQYANNHKQKLLIEIKTTPMDSPQLLDNFITRYEKDILKNHHRIHSLDYKIVTGLKEKAPKLFVSFILPYNFVYPNMTVDAYTMEQTTLDNNFIAKAHAENKQVYIWTVNESTDMDNLFFMNVDGIITDNLSLLNEEIHSFKDNPSYADRLLLYVNQLTTVNNPDN